MEQIIRMAVIGTGSMGRQYAEWVTEGKAPHMKISAVTARKDEAVAWAKEKLNPDVAIFRSTEELFEHPECYDAVLVVTPHPTHCDIVCRAFELGKHVFCDKPLSHSLKQAIRMVETAKKHPELKFAIMFHMRYFGVYMKVKELMEQGAVGQVQRMTLQNYNFLRTEFYHHSSPWRSSWTGEGGGMLINPGHHLLDVYTWIAGVPDRLYANMKFGKYNDFLVDDEATIVMDYDDGRTGTFMMSSGEGIKEEKFEIVGTTGSINVQGTQVILQKFEDSVNYRKTAKVNNAALLKREEPVVFDCPTVLDRGDMLENFARAILFGDKLVAPGEEGLNALNVATGAYLSGWEHREVALPIDPEEYERGLEAHVEMEKNK
ncbi:MAG: Gfo/Idh/MocA family oxidoreductase [Lachnospiraceae bacterium]|nr:Gfo/Idh/MocA family oxidoreductase [Lachnospiraceae bacterium]